MTTKHTAQQFACLALQKMKSAVQKLQRVSYIFIHSFIHKICLSSQNIAGTAAESYLPTNKIFNALALLPNGQRIVSSCLLLSMI